MLLFVGEVFMFATVVSGWYTPHSSDIYCRLLKGFCARLCPAGLTPVRASFLCKSGRTCCFNIYTPTPPPTTTRPQTPGCGISAVSPASSFTGQSFRIIGGQRANPDEFPWVVSIYSENGPCGGVLIDDRNVLTATHCIIDLVTHDILPNIRVNISEYDKRKSDFQEIRNAPIDSVRVHSEFSTMYANDVAVIRLRDIIDFSQRPGISPICLPSENEPPPVGTNCVVIGWGTISPIDDKQVSPTMLKVTIPVVEDAFCRQLFTAYYYKPTNVCAGDQQGGRDACGGDSGGPLMCPMNGRWQVTGIVSFGTGCAVAGTAGVYTKVSSFIKWIQQNKLP